MTGVVYYLVCFFLFLFSCRVRRRSSKAKTLERQQSRFIRGDVKKLNSLLIPLKVI